MSSMKGQQEQLRSGERGSIMIMTAIFALLLLLMVGLCLDVSRIYLVRAELQNAADAAALTAAREISGGESGIDSAVAQARDIVNTQGLRAKTAVTVATVSFAANLNDDPYILAYDINDPTVTTTAAKAQAASIRFVKVTTQPTSTNILFASSALGASHNESREAVAGVSVGLSGICDFFPAAVALNDADPLTPEFDPPADNTLMTLQFSQGTGNSAVLVDKDYIILEVPDITGNGQVETAMLTAGVNTFCKSLGDNIHMTPSSNVGNGPRAAGDGMNTRFGMYANGYGSQLKPDPFYPDTNVQQNIMYTQYLNGTPQGNFRRRLIVPIILPGTYPAYTSNILFWGVFFLKSPVPTPSGNCSNTPGCGAIPVEYVGKAQVNASGGPSCTSGLTAPVLFR